MSPTPAIHTASASTLARGSHTPNARMTGRSVTTLAFAGLTFALCVMKALGWEVEYELLIFTASVAGLDSVAGLVRGGVGAIGSRRAERTLRSDGGARELDEGDDVGDLNEQAAQAPVHRAAQAEVGRSDRYPVGIAAFKADIERLMASQQVHRAAQAEAARSGMYEGLKGVVPWFFGKAAFDIYNAGGSDPRFINITFQGSPCPAWSDLPENVQEKWTAVGLFARALAVGEIWAEEAYAATLRGPAPTDAEQDRLDGLLTKATP